MRMEQPAAATYQEKRKKEELHEIAREKLF
jgi:hypothetical protein